MKRYSVCVCEKWTIPIRVDVDAESVDEASEIALALTTDMPVSWDQGWIDDREVTDVDDLEGVL